MIPTNASIAHAVIIWPRFAPTSSLNCVNAINLFVLCEYVGITLTAGALGAAL